jgi:hypothetical protein
MGGLNAVEVKKLGLGVAKADGLDGVADRPEKRVIALAEVEAGGLHLAGLRFEVAPIWSLIQFWNDA